MGDLQLSTRSPSFSFRCEISTWGVARLALKCPGAPAEPDALILSTREGGGESENKNDPFETVTQQSFNAEMEKSNIVQ